MLLTMTTLDRCHDDVNHFKSNKRNVITLETDIMLNAYKCYFKLKQKIANAYI